MSRLLEIRDDFDLAFACDPDSDRHGIVTRQELMNPNHYLTVAAWHLFRTRYGLAKGLRHRQNPGDQRHAGQSGEGAGAARSGSAPVGFKWFVPYLLNGRCGLGCEESAGASFLCFDGSPWSTDQGRPLDVPSGR